MSNFVVRGIVRDRQYLRQRILPTDNPYVCRLKSGETVARMGYIKLVTLIGYRDFRFYSSLIYFL